MKSSGYIDRKFARYRRYRHIAAIVCFYNRADSRACRAIKLSRYVNTMKCTVMNGGEASEGAALRFWRVRSREYYSNNIITRDIIEISDIAIPRKTLNAYT